MKKEEIIYVRILTVIGVSALMAVVLIIGAGSGLFQNIINGINNNTLQLSNADAAIYNIYFYKGLNDIYQILYSITLFGLILTAAAMFVKLKGAGIYAVISSVLSVITGIYLVLCNIFENNSAIKSIIIRFYIKEASNVSHEHLLSFSWITGILLIISGVFCFAVIKSSRLDKIKAYRGNNNTYYNIFIPVIFGCVIMECFRNGLVSVLCEHSDTYTLSAYTCIKNYYFNGAWFFCYPYVLYLILTILGAVFIKKLRLPLADKVNTAWILPIIIIITGIVRSIIYLFNAPPLFGYLTYDEKLCDIIEYTYPIYIIVYILDILFLLVLLTGILQEQYSTKKILTACGITAAVSITGVIICGLTSGLNAMYIAEAAADIIGLLCLFYRRDISRSHH